jgi:hypothetical protein
MSLVARHHSELSLNARRDSHAIHAFASDMLPAAKALLRQGLGLIFALTMIALVTSAVVASKFAIWTYMH